MNSLKGKKKNLLHLNWVNPFDLFDTESADEFTVDGVTDDENSCLKRNTSDNVSTL